jgi:hypothetical protein
MVLLIPGIPHFLKGDHQARGFALLMFAEMHLPRVYIIATSLLTAARMIKSNVFKENLIRAHQTHAPRVRFL